MEHAPTVEHAKHQLELVGKRGFQRTKSDTNLFMEFQAEVLEELELQVAIGPNQQEHPNSAAIIIRFEVHQELEIDKQSHQSLLMVKLLRLMQRIRFLRGPECPLVLVVDPKRPSFLTIENL